MSLVAMVFEQDLTVLLLNTYPVYSKIRVILFKQCKTTNEKGTQNDF